MASLLLLLLLLLLRVRMWSSTDMGSGWMRRGWWEMRLAIDLAPSEHHWFPPEVEPLRQPWNMASLAPLGSYTRITKVLTCLWLSAVRVFSFQQTSGTWINNPVLIRCCHVYNPSCPINQAINSFIKLFVPLSDK
ncbi:hypothetical protein BO85DRAFT_435776 [Aspergillus piperis CBS 112811]|uniref:Secreted protein n=1 Tax=Aspergillus piperis CBS 112811 TaxID=1448313 RepID=A0A8G1VPU7_9EURO|nr:hypothetical protein BO85DRAFT_435776 [Aspergillus piperis CBS 112811]RAH60082.1 hypothetical protein BO85DRAFT_435776 [Aspergillus piperis CBS 112811]